jgi:transposase
MKKEIVEYILPAGLLEYFSIKRVEEVEEATTKAKEIEIELEEKNIIHSGYDGSQYESKGFIPTKKIQDFPIRGKAVYLLIKRRRWRHKINKNEIITNDYSFFAEGTKITQELSDFLKYTGRDPGRYS